MNNINDFIKLCTVLYSAIFDGENIDRQHLRPLVLAILLETIEREIFDGLLW